jgi:hypothetical protein
MAIGFDAPAGAREEQGRLVAGRRTRHTPPTGLVAAPDVPAEEFEAPAAAEAGTPRSRRRVGWRKGEDVDRELWPAESFGGVSDEQFWDDLASDKPLATTARTAQPESGSRPRLPEVAATANGQAGADRARGDSRAPGRGRRAAGETLGSYPPPSGDAADQTLIQPAQAATGPAPVATQPYPSATQSSPSAAQPVHAAARPVHSAAPQARAATQPVRAAAPPARAATQPARGARHQAGADDDPLTSPAYSLRRQGSVDGHSSLAPAEARHSDGRPDGYLPGGRPDPLRPDPLRPDGAWPGSAATTPARSLPGPGSGGTQGGTVVRPYAAPRYGEHAQPAQPGQPTSPANTPPYGETYGYGNQPGPGRTVGVGDDLRRPDGQWGSDRPKGNGTWSARPVYPPVNGYGAPYDPRGGDRRLSMR